MVGWRAAAAAAIVLTWGVGTAGAAEPDSLPLVEVGVAGGIGYLPDYPGAGQSRPRGLVLPYLRYRGEIIRSDEKGLLRGRLLRRTDLELDVSLAGSFPADADDNEARRGMPDLDWMGEIGPRLQVTLARPSPAAKLDFELPVRAVFSTDLSRLDYRGIVVAPELAYQRDRLFGLPVRAKLGVSPVFATAELMDYFYAVAPRFARPGRPGYDAAAGYLGTHVTLGASYPVTDRVTAVGFLRDTVLIGATNADSPLLRSDNDVSIGVAFTVSLFRSARRAPID